MENIGKVYMLNDGRELKRKLKEKFNFNFSVRRRGHWFHVDWEDGPNYKAVDSFCNSFHDNKNDDITTDLWCGSQYILLQHTISKGARIALLSKLSHDMGWDAEYSENEPGGFSLPGRDWQDHLTFEHWLNELIANSTIE